MAIVAAYTVNPGGGSQWWHMNALGIGLWVGLAIWPVLAALVYRFTAPETANVSSFGEFRTRLTQLNARLQTLPSESETAGADDGQVSGSQRVARQEAERLRDAIRS